MMRPIFRLAAARPARAAGTQPAFRRPFSVAQTFRLKEDGDRSGEELDQKKHEQLDKQKKGKGEWHEELASSSESNVAADNEKVDDHASHLEDLQKQTAGQSQAEHDEGNA
ncbi:hypothetical protein LTR53_007431 [Teratosphaeriaceae sp. CCFEE 6253]|nr:hypothetical protein LTR53_007431 [Teratosphaeriaceae sp. CCFEE 6253]